MKIKELVIVLQIFDLFSQRPPIIETFSDSRKNGLA